MKNVRRGFTLIELLTVIAIISLLLALALPALNEARFHARKIGDKASLSSIATAVETFNNEFGFYPDSTFRPAIEEVGAAGVGTDQGAHRLFEALAGLDHLGYQKDHHYETDAATGEPVDLASNLTERYGPYLKLESLNIGTMQDAHPDSTNFPAAGNSNEVFLNTVDPSTPRAILYYRAHESQHKIGTIYHYEDNSNITQDTLASNSDPIHPKFDEYDATNFNDEEFEQFIWNPKTGTNPSSPTDPTDNIYSNARPYNKGSFLLINAGRDGEYGTQDDITNYLK